MGPKICFKAPETHQALGLKGPRSWREGKFIEMSPNILPHFFSQGACHLLSDAVSQAGSSGKPENLNRTLGGVMDTGR